MTQNISKQNVRLLVGAVATVGLGVLFVPAFAHAHTPGSFDHPWHDRFQDILMLALASIALVSAVSVFMRCSAVQRLVAGAVAALPVYVLARFTAWVVGLSSS